MTENYSNLLNESNSQSTVIVKGVDLTLLRESILEVEDVRIKGILFDLWQEALTSRAVTNRMLTVLDHIASEVVLFRGLMGDIQSSE
jgi:hypothetical protein